MLKQRHLMFLHKLRRQVLSGYTNITTLLTLLVAQVDGVATTQAQTDRKVKWEEGVVQPVWEIKM